MSKRLNKLVLITPLLITLGGCTVGPDYVRQEFKAPAAWRVDLPRAAALANARWWQALQDPVLDELIDAALRENNDLRIASARVEQYLGQLRTTRAQFFPQLDYGLDASHNRMSGASASAPPPGADLWYKQYQGSLSAAWQIDLFGRVRRQSEAAQARVHASEAGRRGTLLTVVASVASGYITLRALDRKLEIARATASNHEGSLRVFQLRFQGGVVSQVEVAQIESQYQQALAAIPALERQIAAQENLLAVLLGRVPGPIARGKPLEALALPPVPPDLPAALIARRPDVLAAEHQLIAANADIGAARALYFPTFNLTGMLGSVSATMANFLSGPAGVAKAAASLAGPIFSFGDIEGRVQSAEAARREALARYQQTLLVALQDANDALLGTQKAAQSWDAQSARVKSLREFARLSRLRFENGSASYIEVYSAENELFGAELVAIDGSAERLMQMVAIYKAFGGGWVDAVDLAGQTAPAT